MKKEYTITGRLPGDSLDPDPIVIARYNGKDETEALSKFKRGLPNIPILGWIVTKFIY